MAARSLQASSTDMDGDGSILIAQFIAKQGVPIPWNEFVLVSHNWPTIFSNHSHFRKMLPFFEYKLACASWKTRYANSEE